MAFFLYIPEVIEGIAAAAAAEAIEITFAVTEAAATAVEIAAAGTEVATATEVTGVAREIASGAGTKGGRSRRRGNSFRDCSDTSS